MNRNSSGGSARSRARKPSQHRSRTQLHIEPLEDRSLPSCNSISGYVFHDSNNNGVFDSNESPIAGSVVELYNAAGVRVGTATTDDSGLYVFDEDETIDTGEITFPHYLVFPDGPTNSQQQQLLPQFDPALGQLLSVEIALSGQVTSRIEVENRDPSPATSRPMSPAT